MQKSKSLSVLFGVIVSVLVLPSVSDLAFADVISVNTQKISYDKGENVVFYGTETLGQKGVSVVIRDSAGEFVTLLSTVSNSNGYYQTLPIDSDDLFIGYGTYEATAFANDQREEQGTTITMRYSDSVVTVTPPIPNRVYVITDHSLYDKGDNVYIFGQFPIIQKFTPVNLMIKDSRGTIIDSVDVYPDSDGQFSYISTSDLPNWKFSGQYTIIAQHMHYQAFTNFGFRALTTQPVSVPTPSDDVKPLVLVPDDIVAKVSGTDFARISFSVTAIDDVDGIIAPKCSHSNRSEFPLGQTQVTCTATDSSGNSDTKSFFVIVTQKNNLVPTWVRGLAGQWCSDKIDENNYSEALQYLTENNVIDIPQSKIFQMYSGQHIPTWVKDTTCWWSDGIISDREFLSGMKFLISNGIVRV
jgi:hypothetical protein